MAKTVSGNRLPLNLSWTQYSTPVLTSSIDAAGISVKVIESYPGRSVSLPCATDIKRCWEGLAEVSKWHSRLCSTEPKA